MINWREREREGEAGEDKDVDCMNEGCTFAVTIAGLMICWRRREGRNKINKEQYMLRLKSNFDTAKAQR